MTHDWLLVETLGSEPAVVAQGPRTKNLIPISVFLRRNPNLMAIQSAIGETVRGGGGLSSITPKNDRVIRTEVVKMSDGLIHGVHLWIGPPELEPPDRPIPGPLIWDLTSGVATDTTESLWNSGFPHPATNAVAVDHRQQGFGVTASGLLVPGQRSCCIPVHRPYCAAVPGTARYQLPLRTRWPAGPT